MSAAKGKKILVAMSGGVDSSVCAARLLEEGHMVEGVFMDLGHGGGAEDQARAVAAHLGIPLTVVGLERAFRKEVIDYFVGAYAAGRTPNPCVVCNPTVKIGRLLALAGERGMEYLATGHYVRLAPGPAGEARLFRGRDPRKDQSYFLCRLLPEQLPRLLFPHGERTKDEVYAEAARLGLSGRHGAESQDICFLQGRPVGEFLAAALGSPPPPGPVVTVDGEEVGRHRGLIHYTVGQRRGLGICGPQPYYVVAMDAAANRLIIGTDDDLWRAEFLVREPCWQAPRPPVLPLACLVKIRYRHPAAPAVVNAADNGRLRVRFRAPQRAVTPGQFAAFYDAQGDMLLGGAEIV